MESTIFMTKYILQLKIIYWSLNEAQLHVAKILCEYNIFVLLPCYSIWILKCGTIFEQWNMKIYYKSASHNVAHTLPLVAYLCKLCQHMFIKSAHKSVNFRFVWMNIFVMKNLQWCDSDRCSKHVFYTYPNDKHLCKPFEID